MRHNPVTSIVFLAALLLPLLAPAETAETTAPCSVCHACDMPTHEAPCLKACARPDTSSAEAATPQNDIIILDKLSSIYVPVVFPHKLHASMESMSDGCTVCHHHSTNGKPEACEKCHGREANAEDLRQPGLRGAYHRQCLSCHREWSHETDCILCHAKRVPGKPVDMKADGTDFMGRLHPNVEAPDKLTYPTPKLDDGMMATFRHKEHIEVFGKKCVDCHVKENCSRCHDSAKSTEKHVRQDPHEDCQKCHDTSGDCTQCHAKEEIPPFDHERRTGYAMKPYHQGIACAKCHTSGEFKGLKRDCLTCHAVDWSPEGFDHAKAGLILDKDHVETACNGCHPNGMGKPTDCSVCHDDKRKYPDKIPGKKPEPAAQSAPATQEAK